MIMMSLFILTVIGVVVFLVNKNVNKQNGQNEQDVQNKQDRTKKFID